MTEDEDAGRDMATLAVPLAGALQETGDPWEPYRIIDAGGETVAAVAEFFRDLQAAGRSEAALRSYAHDLLRWFRFLWAVEGPWDRASPIEAPAFFRSRLGAGAPTPPPGTGRWSPSTSRPAPAPRNCCRRRWPASIPGAR